MDYTTNCTLLHLRNFSEQSKTFESGGMLILAHRSIEFRREYYKTSRSIFTLEFSSWIVLSGVGLSTRVKIGTWIPIKWIVLTWFTEHFYVRRYVVVLNAFMKLVMTFDYKSVMPVCMIFIILPMLVTLFVVSNLTMLHMLFECPPSRTTKLLMFNDYRYTKKGRPVKTLMYQVIENKNMNLNSFCALVMSKKLGKSFFFLW